MNLHRAIAISLVSLLLVTPSLIQAQSNDQLGKVDFQNSCSPALQESFRRDGRSACRRMRSGSTPAAPAP